MENEIKILVADDSAFMRQHVIGYLHEAGYDQIIEAGNGKIALEKFKQEKPEVVLMDIIMPVLNGLETLKKMVPLGAKVILISAIGQQAIIEEAMGLGAKDFLVKPFFTASEIDQKIKAALEDAK
jgi:two-component system, chemotaxis family, chemotaxis protein CheY